MTLHEFQYAIEETSLKLKVSFSKCLAILRCPAWRSNLQLPHSSTLAISILGAPWASAIRGATDTPPQLFLHLPLWMDSFDAAQIIRVEDDNREKGWFNADACSIP